MLIIQPYHCTHINDNVTIIYYPKPNPNHKNGTKYRPQNLNFTKLTLIQPKGLRVTATILGLGFLDTALYLKQYSEDASLTQEGVVPVRAGACG